MGDPICETDLDCRLGLHCFFDEETDGNICGCSGFYGWKGENCTEYGPSTYYHFTTYTIQIMICLVTLILNAKASYILYFVEKIKFKLHKSKSITWIWSTLGILFFIPWRINEIISAASPDENDYEFPDNSHFEKASSFVAISRGLQAGVFICTTNGLLIISIMWLETVYISEKMIMHNQEKTLMRYKYISYAFQFVFAVTILVCVILGNYSILGTISVPFLGVITIAYTAGRIKLVRLVNEVLLNKGSKSDDNDVEGLHTHTPDVLLDAYEQIVYHIKRSSAVIIGALYVLILSALSYGAQDVLVPNYNTGGFAIGIFFAEGVHYSLLVILVTQSWYARKSHLLDRSSKIDETETNTKNDTYIVDTPIPSKDNSFTNTSKNL